MTTYTVGARFVLENFAFNREQIVHPKISIERLQGERKIMPRAVDGKKHKDRRKKVLKQAKGYWGRRSKLYRTAKDAVAKALKYAYRDRKTKKRTFRSLWIARISASCRQNGISYSQFQNGLKKSDIQLNRKTLSNMAIEDSKAFAEIVQKAKESMGIKS